MEDMLIVKCDCGFRVGLLNKDLDEITSGVWGDIPCPACGKRLNDKIKTAVSQLVERWTI